MPMASPTGLTPKQQRFVDEYLIDLNATQAAIRAGYSATGASVEGSRLLANAKIAAIVAQKQAKIAEANGLTLQSHLDTLNALRTQAAAANQYSAAVSAEVSRGKACGLYVEKTETKHSGSVGLTVRIVREGRRVTAS